MSGSETWKERGIISRVLSFLFDEFERRDQFEHKMYVSFMEIYNENAYDLLNKKNFEKKLDEWEKVILHPYFFNILR